ncbi:MAG: CheR family methyltransferase [Thermodesulfobacteriota bacterium]
MAKINRDELKVLSDYIYQLTGIDLDESKDYLVESRLNPLLISYGLQSFSELYYKARSDRTGELEKKIIDAISTNETLFFRDSVPFDQLKYRIIPELLDRKFRHEPGSRINLDIWSAACSSGQEVYSIAISLLEILDNIDKYEISILGTDISQEALANASYGKYSKLEIERGMPREYLQKYFHKWGDGWRINDRIRSMVKFQKLNLMDSYYGLGSFDIVFCRNVAIYFSQTDKRKLFQKLARSLKPQGYLIVGCSESLSGIAPQFESRHYLHGMYYQLKPEQDKSADRQASKPSHAPGPASKPRHREPAKPGPVSVNPAPGIQENRGARLNSARVSAEENPASSGEPPRQPENTGEGKHKAAEPVVPNSYKKITANSSRQSLLSNIQKRRSQGESTSGTKGSKPQNRASLLQRLSQNKDRKK